MKIASVFGGAMNDRTTKEYLDTVQIGRILSEYGYAVKNGGYHGLMEAAAKGAFENGGVTIGCTCKTFHTTIGNEYLTKTIISENIFERLNNLITGTDLFILSRGGIGTLAELFLVLDIVRKKKEKPYILLIGEVWVNIIESLRALVSDKELGYLTIIHDYNDIIPYL